MRPLVSLVGAGPGDPGLLTLRAFSRLRRANDVFYDGLVPVRVARIARAARLVSVARRAGPKAITDEHVVDLMVAAARAGRRVVRLKSGDPFILGRGHEEVLALTRAGVACEVVPGLSSAIAAPLLAGIPITRRGVSAGFLVLSGHAAAAFVPVLSRIPPGSTTVVLLMGMRSRAAIRDCAITSGWPASTPAAVITDASQPAQRVWTGPLADLGSPADRTPTGRAGVIVIGDVVACAGAVGRPRARRAGAPAEAAETSSTRQRREFAHVGDE